MELHVLAYWFHFQSHRSMLAQDITVEISLITVDLTRHNPVKGNNNHSQCIPTTSTGNWGSQHHELHL